MIVKERFYLDETYCQELRKKQAYFGFGGFGEAVYYRTYSRIKPDGSQEHWADTVIRVINGVISVRKNHYIMNDLSWNEQQWQTYAHALADAMFQMQWLPPGRGLWIMGTDYIYERGSAALNNCGAVDTAELAAAADWTMDMLMCGVGVGFNTAWKGENVSMPHKSRPAVFIIPDSREGWVASVRLLIESYTKNGAWHVFDYSAIRPEGSPIKGFGGTASGPAPLQQLHKRIESYLDTYAQGLCNSTRCVADIMNAIGVCVVAGNVRRSAQIALGSIDDKTFLELKDYAKNPERAAIGWVSNNTVVLEKDEDFQKLSCIAKHIKDNGEPGIMNLINVQKYARYGEKAKDKAYLANPCSEIALESFELCNLAEVFHTRCEDEAAFYKALEFAAFYASTVALLPTHRSETNEIILRNRRIGVSLSGITEMLDMLGTAELIRRLRKGYKLVYSLNRKLAAQANIPPSIRVTTVKPSGTISQLVGVSSGMHFPNFRYAIRRMRVANDAPICKLLKSADIPNEPDRYSTNTTVFEFPIDQGKTRKVSEVSAWEQFAFLAMLQREWSDNMVSCTISFDAQEEGGQIEHMLARFVPLIKSVSMMPYNTTGIYEQMPYEEISKEEYQKRLAALKPIDWKKYSNNNDSSNQICCISCR
ncbi:MAG: fused protease/ribonucleoside-triphosphate reductase [Sulfurovum sp.]|nr:fused protease/ribonucleoside-triphosphate reductase [Sulfurovum sp.]